MSFQLTTDKLQGIAISCVTQFMNKEASLSEAIAKQAQDLELNSDQTKRVIEATNTIAYLRQLEKAADRTFEFKVADYNDVMSSMCNPEVGVIKEAGVVTPLSVEITKVHNAPLYMQKSAERTDRENRSWLSKELYKVKGQLVKIAEDKVEIQLSLAKAAAKVRRESHPLEKLAHIVPAEDLDKMLVLCGIEKKASEDRVFTSSELCASKEVYELYKVATETVKLEASKLDFVNRSSKVLYQTPIEKSAGLGEMVGSTIGATIGAGARALGWVGGKALGSLGSVVGTAGKYTIKNPGKVAGVAGTALEAGSMTHTNKVSDLNAVPG